MGEISKDLIHQTSYTFKQFFLLGIFKYKLNFFKQILSTFYKVYNWSLTVTMGVTLVFKV